MSDRLRFWLSTALMVFGSLAIGVATALLYNVWIGLVAVGLGLAATWERLHD